MHPNNPRPLLGRHVRTNSFNWVLAAALVLGFAEAFLAGIEAWHIIMEHRL